MEGKVNADSHVFGGSVMTGAEGKITTLTILLELQEPGLADPPGVVPQSDVRTYCAWMV